ncbi:unnamed protein product [Microthlaspi erraticum]|uniref:Uncharacterized protein n=1 Tax=Microthlaspi erraticum TaxID=1685480 RepID=A0A6D2IAF1_9BRAS|nr:unnamed protein product [Microthlaspi erraticum]
MDLELGTTVVVGVATLLLVPILWLRMQRSNQSQPKYKRGITMVGAILLVVQVVLCIRDLKEHKQYTKIYELGMRILERNVPVALCLLFIVVGRASWGERKYKLVTLITGAIATFVFATLFFRKSTPVHVPERPNYAYLDTGPRRKLTQFTCLHNTKSFDVRKTTTKMVFLLFVALCVSFGT